MRYKVNLNKFLLIVIILLGLSIRVYKLPDIPSGFFTDEASTGYNAYTILKSGKDEHGTLFPIFFQAFGEYKSPVQIYTTIPFIALFGLNEFTTRLPSVIFGILTIVGIFLLTKEFFKNHKHNSWLATIAALFLSISPWHIHFSRTSLEGQTAFILFTTLGLYFFLKAQENTKLLFISTITFLLAIYSYFPARIFTPLLGTSILVMYAKFLYRNKMLTFLNFFLLIVLLTPIIQFTLSPSGFARWDQVNIFSQSPKDESIFQHIITNYWSHFSLDFLFLKGDIDMPGQFITRHSVQGIGELYLFQLPLILLGFGYLLKRKFWKHLTILAIWLILYPVGSMFTVDKSAQATRSIIGVIPLQIMSAVGLYYLITLFSKTENSFRYITASIIVIFISISFLYYLNLYFVKYPLYSSDYWGWQYGYRDIVENFKRQEENFDQLLITHRFNQGETLLKFYNVTYNCEKCMVMTNPISIDINKRQLFALRIDDMEEAKILYPHLKFIVDSTISLPGKKEAIFIGSFNK